MDIKAVVLDVDGTLLKDDKTISNLTKSTLIQIQKSGVKLILASGRPTSGILKVAHELQMDQHHGLIVSYNGASVIDCENNELLFNQAMSIEEGKAVLQHLKNFDVRPMIDKDKYMYVNDVYDCWISYKNQQVNIIEYESRAGNYKLCEKDDLAAFANFEINKILTAGDPDYLQENYKAMMEPFKDSLTCMFTADFYFEYTAKGIDKAKALDTVLLPMGILPEHVAAFGDGPNDKTMIMYSGHGFAMENATNELKDLANYVTLSNEEDGIVYALKNILEII